MFTTEPQDEFHAPVLGASDRRHWRMFRLSLHVPWFLLTVEVPDGEVRLLTTACIAWDTDLATVLESLGEAHVVSLLCMTPGWCSPTGRWAAREVYEVWELETRTGKAVLFRDRHGAEFGDRLPGQPLEEELARRLILKLDPPSEPADIATAKTSSTDKASP